ncbi:uncharacterized protein LOC122320767 [Drosophila ficusphila]|uniref:uncharacterized protein LOC108094555 n=1 Tax=Drosophila ficusphila TaxID=30025 RepID=UPI0007E6CC86|nr:uncharacterized protein LOC108094555 [Drosophila ficusphila]XP_043065139.1 uncharacterized protein LOC122320767 [Drosophila ficusphila]
MFPLWNVKFFSIKPSEQKHLSKLTCQIYSANPFPRNYKKEERKLGTLWSYWPYLGEPTSTWIIHRPGIQAEQALSRPSDPQVSRGALHSSPRGIDNSAGQQFFLDVKVAKKPCDKCEI